MTYQQSRTESGGNNINDTTIKQVSQFQNLGYAIIFDNSNDIGNKAAKFNPFCGSIRNTLHKKQERPRRSLIKSCFIKQAPTVLYSSENKEPSQKRLK